LDSEVGKKAAEAFPVEGQALALVLAIITANKEDLKEDRFKTPEGK